MKFILPLLLAFLILPVTQSEARTIRVLGGQVRVEIPNYAKVRTSGIAGASILLPPSQRFAPNLNIQRQSYPYGIQAYAQLSMNQFRQVGFRVSRQSFFRPNAWQVAYSGRIGNRRLQFYSYAFDTPRGIILITGTALPAQWRKPVGRTLRAMIGRTMVFD